MLAAVKGILGGGEVIKEGFALIDAMHTSKEEELAARSAAKVALLTAYAPFKIAQRILMLMFSTTFLICFGTAFFQVMVLRQPVPADLIDLMGQFYIGEIMLTIVVFYFGGGFVEGAIQARKPNGKGN